MNGMLLLAVFLQGSPDVPAGGVAGGVAGVITTLAGTGKEELGLFSGNALEVNISQPFGVEIGPGGALYICEAGHHRILRLDLKTNRVETVAGNGKKGYGGDGGSALEAMLNEPYEVRFDSEGNMYFVERLNAVVRKVGGKSRTIATVAGSGRTGFGGDGGPADKAELKEPHSIALDAQGSLFIADIGNHRVRRVDLATGRIETIAGNGEARLPDDGALATGKPILGPRALAVTGQTLWIALREGNSLWKMDLSTRRIFRVAGTGKAGYKDGPLAEASFNGPKGIVAREDRELYVADTENQVIRHIDLVTGTVTTVAGSGPSSRGYGGDGGPPTRANLDRPHGIAVDARGTIYVGDTESHRVRRVEKGR